MPSCDRELPNRAAVHHLRRIWTSLSYQHRIAFLILLFALTPILPSGVFLLLREYRVRERAILEGYRASVQTGVHFINGILQTSHTKILYVSNNQDLHLVLSTSMEGNLRSIVASYQGVRDLFKTYTELDAYSSSIAVYALLPGVYHAEYSIPIEDLDPSIRDAVLARAPGEILCSFLDGRFRIATQVVSASRELLGIAELTVPFRVASDVFRFSIPEGAFLAYASSDLSSVMPILLGTAEAEDITATVRDTLSGTRTTPCAVVQEKLQFNGGTVALFVPRQRLSRQLIGFIGAVSFLFGMLVASVILAVILTSRRLTRRLQALVSLADSNMVDLLEGKVLPVVQGDDEFSRIDRLLRDLVTKIREYYGRLTAAEDEKRSLQLLLLQERINPHLLYNTLSSIKWAFPDERLKSVIDAMVNYYRTTLKRGNEMLTVGQEIELIDQYLILQRFAYRSESSFVVEIDDTIRDIIIPKHLLQPFVENAFLHGINGLDEGGCITVRALRVSQAVVFEIVDNGVGMPQEKANALIQDGLPGTAAGYGIRNTRRRLELAYGLAGLVSIRSAVNSGTTVTIRIPTV